MKALAYLRLEWTDSLGNEIGGAQLALLQVHQASHDLVIQQYLVQNLDSRAARLLYVLQHCIVVLRGCGLMPYSQDNRIGYDR